MAPPVIYVVAAYPYGDAGEYYDPNFVMGQLQHAFNSNGNFGTVPGTMANNYNYNNGIFTDLETYVGYNFDPASLYGGTTHHQLNQNYQLNQNNQQQDQNYQQQQHQNYIQQPSYVEQLQQHQNYLEQLQQQQNGGYDEYNYQDQQQQHQNYQQQQNVGYDQYNNQDQLQQENMGYDEYNYEVVNNN